uniref:N-acetyltransferase 16 n=1 Tax=Nothobranchius furzeri TaxID=105023 RepID=A0A8C6LUN7_NOTFU
MIEEVFPSSIWQIALESVCVIDDGETMLVEGLRVAPEERGKGVAGVLLRFCSELVKSKYPDVKVSRLTRDDQAEDLKLRLSDITLHDSIYPSLSTSSSSPPPVRLDHESIHQLYLRSDLMKGLLPNATVIQDWQPFKLLPSNFTILLKKDIDWMVNDVSSPTVASLCTFPFKVIGIGNRYYLNIDMYGKDLNLVKQQFLSHLECHTATLKGHVMCQMFLDPALWKPMADFCHSALNVELVKEYTEQCVVESDAV